MLTGAQHVKLPKEITDFYADLNKMHKQVMLELPPFLPPANDKVYTLDQGIPLLSFINLEFNEEMVNQALGQAFAVISRYRPQVAPDLVAMQTALKTSAIDMATLAEKYLWQDDSYIEEFAAQRNLERELFDLVLYHTVKPFAENFAKALSGRYSAEHWEHSYCPVCGWKPVMATNMAENKGRLLHCSMCETQWRFKSIKCPHCLNEDHETLLYFTVENDEIYRVYGCKKCKGYIKTVDEGKLIKRESAFLTDLKTLHLDLLAAREGFTKDIEMPGGKSREIN